MTIIADKQLKLQEKSCNIRNSEPACGVDVNGEMHEQAPVVNNYPIEKKPVVAIAIIRRRGEIHTRPCIFEGSPTHILQHEMVLGVVPAPDGIYAVEYLSKVMEDDFDDDSIPVDLGYEWPNRSETPDWQTRAGEVEERRRSFFGLSPAKRAEILKAAE
jgi:hypothetical protein